jgi:transposase
MAKAYSDDLRRKLLEAHRLGEGSLDNLAGRFRVSVSWAKSVSATWRRTGRMEKPPAGPRGPRSKLTPEIQGELCTWIELQPDLTLMELQQRLVARRGLYSSLSRLWEVLGAMGLRLKKSRFTPRSRTRKKAGASARSGASRRVR